jgi:hypothetical protein
VHIWVRLCGGGNLTCLVIHDGVMFVCLMFLYMFWWLLG